MRGDLCHLSRHGRRFYGGDPRNLPAGRRAVRLVPFTAPDPDPGAVDPDRHRTRALAIEGILHRDLDDRFFALAGIIVRNSILLVDFIRRRRAEGAILRRALLEAGAICFKPIFLTAAAAMISAAFIITDPIFQGLAISLVFGLVSSILRTVLVIPAVYVWLHDDHKRLGA
jgi:hypothetical protein